MGIEAGWGIEAGEGISAAYVFSFQFSVNSKWLVTTRLPFWREFYAEMPPMKEFSTEIRNEDNCWRDLKAKVTKEKAEEICKWEGWHPILRAQLEMFFELKSKVFIEV